MNPITYRRINSSDKDEVNHLMKERWGSEVIVVHNSIYIPSNLSGFIAMEEGITVGLITYDIDDEYCEIVTLDSMKENCGIGSKLINMVKQEAIKNNCTILRLITTNDNLHAISFYEKRGFNLSHVYAGAVEESRKIKPEIPLVASNGIPIKDEFKFTLDL